METFNALYLPPEKSRLCIVIWDISCLSNHSLNVIGLFLRLDPRFVRILPAKFFPDDYSAGKVESRPLFAKHVVIGDSIIAFGHYKAYKNTSLPFFLIATSIITSNGIDELRQEIGGYELPGHEGITVPQSAAKPPDQTYHWLLVFKHLLLRILSQEETGSEDDELPLAALLAISRLESLKAKIYIREMRAHLRYGQPSDEMYRGRESLRRWCEDTMDALEHLSSYISREHNPEWLRHPIYQKLVGEIEQSVTQATRIEAEARDFLQIRSGAMALEETKRSIELSDYQIQEGKRGMSSASSFVYKFINRSSKNL